MKGGNWKVGFGFALGMAIAWSFSDLPIASPFVTTAQAQTTQDLGTSALNLLKQGQQLGKAKQYERAIDYFQRSLIIFRQIKNNEIEQIEPLILIAIGNCYINIGNIQEARKFLLESIEIAKKIGDRTTETQANDLLRILSQQYPLLMDQNRKTEADRLRSQGEQLYKTSRYHEAFQILEQSLQIYQEIQDYQGEATSINNLGAIHDSLSEYQKAINSYHKSLEIYQKIGNRYGESMSLNNLGNTYSHLREYQKALDFFEQALKVLRLIDDGESYRVAVLLNMGDVYRNRNQYLKAIDFYNQSLAISRKIGSADIETKSLNNLGIVYEALGQYQKAIDFCQQALAIAQKIGSAEIKAASFNNLGKLHTNLGQYQIAIDFSQQSLGIFRQIGNLYGEAVSLNNLSSVYSEIGQYQKAIDFSQQALSIARQMGTLDVETGAITNLSAAYGHLGEHQKSIDFSQQSLAIAKKISDLSGEATSLNNLASVYNSLKEYQKSINFYQRSLAITRQLGELSSEASALNNLGSVYDSLGEYQKSIDFYQQSLAIKKKIGDVSGEAITLNNIGAALNAQSHDELAILFFKQSIRIRESTRDNIKKLNKEEQQSFVNSIAYTYRNTAKLLLKQDRIIEAIQVLDLLKVQELEDYLKNIKGNDRTKQGLRLLPPEANISPQLSTINYQNIPEINRQLANQIQQLPKSEINRVPDYLKQIPQGSVLLYPLILDDRIELILFSPNTIPINRTVKIPKQELEALIKTFIGDINGQGNDATRKTARKLYEILIRPIEADLVAAQAETILYAPDGALRYIPLAALHDGKQWLAEKYRISNLIAYILTDFTPKPKTQPKVLAGAFGSKKKFGQLGLPSTIADVQAIARKFPNSTTLIEDNFSRKAIESQFPNHNIIHLGTHAEFNPGVADSSFILFGNGDKIRFSEITDWQLPNVDLIVLSACRSGVSEKLGTGVEILGFGYQMQKIGAKTAIATLWNVDDQSTQPLMEAFYSELQKGDVSVTEALHRAQISLIKSPDDRENHPKFWAGFFAIGNGL